MATKKSQRIAIWIIAIVMLAGTIGGFIAMMVAPANEARDLARFEEEQKNYTTKYQEREQKLDEQAEELSKTYYPEFSGYSSRVSAFNASEVSELKTEDLKEGSGATIDGDLKFAAYYIGWNPSGEIFDQSIEGESLKRPLAIDGLDSASLIEGWIEGMKGMKIGGIREITIPSEKAYGEQGGGELIPPNTPIKFVVMAIEKPEEIPEPEMSEYLEKEYQRRGYGNIY